jgi:hypothetical protein
MIFSSMVISKNSVTRLLILDKEGKPPGSVYIPYVKGVSKKLKIYGIDMTLGRTSKLNTLLGVRS